ncbi:hypothetical protein [Lewinella sp. IMCC34183]|uniref:hypothetical protein n=1 Tax=Lewinella sp. IMCC34183 TaxID=2248762 RepID=UPI000E255D69|nr:hypothetical protein [Lewinella sp. IMCC34183]
MPRTRLTAFSRFLLFLLIALPIVYFGAAWYNGEDPVANVRGWLGMTDEGLVNEQTYEEPAARDRPATFENVQELRAENARLRADLERCRSGKEI